MSYPNKPENRLLIKQGDEYIDLFDEFHMFLVDGYTDDPPEPKIYTVDIPGGNGKLDLTDSLLGDCAYEPRKQEFTFYILDIIDTQDLAKIKTQVHNFLHGKDFDYVWTIDTYFDGYTKKYYKYHGRFTISDLSHDKYANVNIAHQMKITIESDPFKYKDTQTRSMPALGGTIALFQSGRKSVQPEWQTEGQVRIIFNNKQYDLKEGTYIIPDIVFKEGTNKVYISTYPVHKITWGDLKNGYETHPNPVTWAEFYTKDLFEWYKTGPGYIEFARWMDVSNTTWSTWMDKGWKWQDFIYREDSDYPTIITVKSLKWEEWADKINPDTGENFKWEDFPFTDTDGIFGIPGKTYEIWNDMLYVERVPITIKNVNMKYEWGDL